MGPKIVYIRGIPKATEFPKHDENPKTADWSVRNLNNFLLTKKDIKNIKVPEPKKAIKKLNKYISGKEICQKFITRAIGKRILKLILVKKISNFTEINFNFLRENPIKIYIKTPIVLIIISIII